ncbi:precorrin-6Y C5,15-methyltransferase (decarboxylating) subunit CbiT [Halorubrum gandharaense]
MQTTRLPNDAKAGPTKPEVRAVLERKLALGPDDHFVEVGSCTGAVTVEAARRAGRVTALERKPDRLETTRANLAANGVDAGGGNETGDQDDAGDDAAGDQVETGDESVSLVHAEAPEGLPADGTVLFLGGSRNYEAILDAALDAGYDRIVMNVSRLEVAGEAARAFRERDVLDETLCLQVATGYDLAGATSFDANNPVYMLIAEPGSPGDQQEGGA